VWELDEKLAHRTQFENAWYIFTQKEERRKRNSKNFHTHQEWKDLVIVILGNNFILNFLPLRQKITKKYSTFFQLPTKNHTKIFNFMHYEGLPFQNVSISIKNSVEYLCYIFV
jgi:hypothetical protein